MKVFCVLVCLIAVASAIERQEILAPQYGGKPNPEWSRKPSAAKSEDQIVPVIYSAISHDEANAGADATNPTHVRAADDKVIISQDPKSSFNSTGEYQSAAKEKCCTICPKDDECKGSSCYSKCHKFCGAQCVIPKAGVECTISVDCGLTSSSQSIQGDQDMVEGYEKMKAPAGRTAGTPDEPLKGEGRYPLPERAEDKKDYDDATAIEAEATESPEDSTGPTGPDAETTAAEEDATGPTGPTGPSVVSVQEVAVKTVKSLR